MANSNLKSVLAQAGLTAEQLADIVEVDPKTVQRWVSGRVPYRRHRATIARALDVPEHELWPDTTPAPATAEDARPAVPATAVGAVCEVVATWGRPNAVGTPNLATLLGAGCERIDVLNSGSVFTRTSGSADQVLGRAREGCHVRIVDEELTPELQPLLGAERVQVRTMAMDYVHGLCSVDDRLLLWLWLAGDALVPLLDVRRQVDDGLFDQLLAHFDAVWNHAQPTASDQTPMTSPTDPDHLPPRPRRWPERSS